VATEIVGTTFTDEGLANGTTYYYWVTAVHGLPPGTQYEGSASDELAIAPTPYDFSFGFPGTSLDPTVQGALGSRAVLSLNGYNVENVRLFGSTLQLTDGGTNQTDSVFTRNPVDVTRFTTHFTFELVPSLGYVDPLADGITFTIQGIGPTVLGGSGGGLGYAGIPDSVAVKFDLHDGAGEGPNSTGLFVDGELPEGPNSIDLDGTGIDLHSGHRFSVSISYDGAILDVTITDTVTLATASQSYTVDIPAIVGGDMAYVGFTAGTGGLTSVQSLFSWIFTPAPAAPENLEVSFVSATQVSLSWTNVDPNATAVIVERKTGAAGVYAQIGGTGSPTVNTFSDLTVEPGTTYYYRVRAANLDSTSVPSNEIAVATSAAGGPEINFPDGFAGAAAAFSFNGSSAGMVGSSLQLTDGAIFQAASIFRIAPVNVVRFTTQFDFELLSGTTPTADGMTFTIQGIGPAALGGAGGALGYASIETSVAVKFDLYDNDGEGVNSTGLYLNGTEPNAAGSISLVSSGIDLHSEHVFRVRMDYDGTTLDVTITDTVTLASASQSYTVDIPAIVGSETAYVGFTGGTGGLTAVQNVLNWTYASQSSVAGRHLFYNQSAFDGNNAAINAADAIAIAPDKSAYLPGSGQAMLANLTNFDKGINGIMVDLAGAGNHAAIAAGDFVFKVGTNNSPGTWVSAPAPSAVVVSLGAGVGGSDRVTVTWAAGAIKDRWLEVQVLATTHTGLTSGDVHFWGNLVGETATSTPGGAFARTVAADGGAIIVNGTQGSVGITNPLDINKSNSITVAADRGPIVASGTGTLTRISIAAGGPFAPEGEGAEVDHGVDSAVTAALAAPSSQSVAMSQTIWRFDSPRLNIEANVRPATRLGDEAPSIVARSRAKIAHHDPLAVDLVLDDELLDALLSDNLLVEGKSPDDVFEDPAIWKQAEGSE
jgi:hypothetical protein